MSVECKSNEVTTTLHGSIKRHTAGSRARRGRERGEQASWEARAIIAQVPSAAIDLRPKHCMAVIVTAAIV